MEAAYQEGSLPFLDTLVSVGTNGSLVMTVYRNPTHMDQYLHWESHHNVTNKYSIFNTLTHRAWTVCSNQQLLGQEQHHIQTALVLVSVVMVGGAAEGNGFGTSHRPQ